MKKEIKHYRYRKVTPEILEKIKKLKASGMNYGKIAEKLKIVSSTVGYWLNPETRKKTIKRANKFYTKLTPEQRKRSKKSYGHQKEYYMERYHNDEEFKKRIIKHMKKSFKKRKEKWISEGNCSICGKKRKDKKFKTCEKCRKK